jgi:Dolichyl-phosphate-mannose-protein mannosyltransferase
MTPAVNRVARWAPHVVGMVVYGFAVCWFASNQQLWTDETTQLSGLRLDPVEVVRWLAGVDRQRFGVPGDRMPPLSYWIGWSWSQVFGLSEHSLRMLAALSVGVALLFLIETAQRCFGKRSAWVLALGCGLSPNWLTFGAEIRTYPLLLLASAIAFWAFSQLCEGPKERHARYWLLLAGSGLCAAYAHFFGLVMMGSLACASVLLIYRRALPWKLPALLSVAYGVLVVGLLPFLRSAVEMSQAPEAGPRAFQLVSAVRLVYRLLGGHPAVGFSLAASALVVVGTAGCIALTLSFSRLAVFPTCLAVSLFAGLGADLFAGVLSKGFDPFTAAYNIWLLPPVGLLFAGCIADERIGRAALFAKFALGAALLGTVLGAGNLLANPGVYAHGAARSIAARVKEAAGGDLGSVVVVHDAGESWGHTYFPLLFEFGTSVQQVLAKENPETHALSLERVPEGTPITLDEIRSKKLLFATTRNQGASELGRFVTSGQVPDLGRAELSRALAGSGCQKLGTQAYVALSSTEMSTLQCR